MDGPKSSYLFFIVIFLFSLIGLFSSPTYAHAETYQQFYAGSAVTLGEFVYNDDYTPTTDVCTLSVSDPTGTVVLSAVTMTADANGWHHYSFTPSTTLGVWPAFISCGSSGAGTLIKEDKTFLLVTAPATQTDVSNASSSVTALTNAHTDTSLNTATTSLAAVVNGNTNTQTAAVSTVVTNASSSLATTILNIPSLVWAYSSRTLSDFGTLVAQIWSNTTRRLTDAILGTGNLALQSDVTSASSSVAAIVNNNTNTQTAAVTSAVNSHTDTATANETTNVNSHTDSATGGIASAVNTNTNATVLAASTSLAANINTNTNTQTTAVTSAVNSHTDTATGGIAGVATAVNSHTDSALNTASSSISAIVNNNTNTQTAAVTTVVNNASSSLASSILNIPIAVWTYSSRTLSNFGTLVADIWSNTTRRLTDAVLGTGNLALQSDVTSASSSIAAVVNNNTNTQTAAVTSAVNSHTDTATGNVTTNVNAHTDTATGNETTNVNSHTDSATAGIVSSVNSHTDTDTSGISGVATAVNSHTDSALNTASSSIAAVVNNNTNTQTSGIASTVNTNTNATVLAASTSLASNINTNTNTQTAAVTTVVNNASSSLGASILNIPVAVWTYSSRTLTNFGSLVSDIWSNTTRRLSDAVLGVGSLALQSDVTSASSSVAAVVNNNTNTQTSAVTTAVNGHTDTATGNVTTAVNAHTDTATGNITSDVNSHTDSATAGIVTGVNGHTDTATANETSNVNAHTDTATGGITSAVNSNTNTVVGNASSSITALVNTNTNAVVNSASSSLASAISSVPAISGSWAITLTDTQVVLEGNTYRAKLTATDNGLPANTFAAPLVTLYDASRNVTVSAVSMTNVGTGVYEYTFSVPSSAAQGSWEIVTSTQVESGKNVSANEYWEVTGSPAQVIINSMGSVATPDISANLTITNEGLTGYEYHYEWCVVTDVNNACGGNDDVYYGSAAKFINPGDDFNTTLTATVPTAGNYFFKARAYFGTESSGASRSFTATGSTGGSGDTGGGSSGGGGGGGGGGGSSSTSGNTSDVTASVANALSSMPADFNADHKVNSIDFSILLAFWKTQPPFKNPAVDINKDGKVDSIDFSILLYEWNR